VRIVVPVKQVPDPTSPARFAEDRTLDRAGTDAQLSELDEYAVEQAVSLVEHGLDATITYLSVGPERATDALRKALAMGGDEAVHVSDPALHGSDALSTSLVLAQAVERIGFDLVLCGMSSTDGEMGVVPAMLAERLQVPQLTFASDLAVSEGSVTATRDSGAALERAGCPLPALVSVTDQVGEARYPSFRSILAAKKKPVTAWSLADLGLEPQFVGLRAAATAVTTTTPQPPRTAGEVITDEGDAAGQVAEFLAAHQLL
jgi:electron transfer flavoprotein beta subunit